MLFPTSFHVSTPSEYEIRVTRDFNARRQLVFEAFTKPDLIRRWLLGPPGWSMPLCEIDLRIGGSYRYVWRSEKDGSQMAVGGVFRDVISLERLVCTERFDDAWYPGEAEVTTKFTETNGITKTTITIRYESREARDTARRSGMEIGLAAGYDRLETLLLTFIGGNA
jgi:uncharacterized protein YndB with AHSA1/START domain